MSVETISVIGILLTIWTILLLLDLIISGLAAAISGASFKKTFLWGLLSLALPPILMIYGTLIERNTFRLKEVELSFTNLPEAFDGYKIVHISDIHARSFTGRRNSLQRATDKINAQNADLIAFTGDIITLEADELKGISDILAKLSAEDGVVSIAGNHDYCIYGNTGTSQDGLRQVIETEMDMGWEPLMNGHKIIRKGQDSIAIIGVENTSPSRHFPSRGDLNAASEGTEGMFRILLSHDPMHWEAEVSGKDYPLTLSGHTHAMQFSIFGWSPSKFIFRQNKGLYSQGEQYLYVNIGLGETIFPARIGARPEITLIKLKIRQ